MTILPTLVVLLAVVGFAVAAPHGPDPARASTTPHVRTLAPCAAEDDWCWSALVDGNHRGHYMMRDVLPDGR